MLLLLIVGGVVLVTRDGGGGGGTPLAAGSILLESNVDPGPDAFTGEIFAAPATPPTIPPRPTPISTPSAFGTISPRPTAGVTPATPTPATPGPTPSGATPTPTPGGLTPTPTAGATAGPTVVQTSVGSTPGLYGGTNEDARCDREALATFLERDPVKAGAWIEPLNRDATLQWSGGRTVATSQIRPYIMELTPLILTSDTRVTNHGFRDGRATPRQSVLQAGTYVLVDRYGIPRAKCMCGNPLVPPIPATTTPTYTGTPWQGFSPPSVVVVNPAPTIINNFTTTNITNNTFVDRPAGTTGTVDTPSVTQPTPPATTRPTPPVSTPTPLPSSTLSVPPTIVVGGGDVQFTLIWGSDHDVDLHVIDPASEEILYSHRDSASGGHLDVDDIPSCGETDTNVENVFWPSGGAPSGTYTVYARNLGSCTGGNAHIRLEIRVRGTVVDAYELDLATGADTEHYTVQVG